METLCCVTCNSQVQAGVGDTALLVLPALLLVLAVTGMLIFLTHLAFRKRFPRSEFPLSPVPVVTASMILGAGLGGFVDGILFHQVLQSHAMLSSRISTDTLEGKSINMFWDGIFHLGMLGIVVFGTGLLWNQSVKEVDKSGRYLWGGILTGWALFNLAEGVIDHQALQLHNVVEAAYNPHEWNYGFLMASGVVWIIGFMIALPKMR